MKSETSSSGAGAGTGTVSQPVDPGTSPAPSDDPRLPIVDDCQGCGVCCLHMGYPAFLLPRPPMTEQQIDADPRLSAWAHTAWRRAQLLQGSEGEVHWHQLPAKLKNQLEQVMRRYEAPTAGLDGPCIWLDLETRRCRHHEYRPRVCRDFQVGSTGCRQWREAYRDLIAANPDAPQQTPASSDQAAAQQKSLNRTPEPE